MSTWTMTELVAEAARRIEALPAPKNGQVRAVPDERTVRYYGTIGLLDRPSAMRGRTALYGDKHLAQIVAIKRMQAIGRSLAEIQAIWSTLDVVALQRMSGVSIATIDESRGARPSFWKVAPATRIELAPNVFLEMPHGVSPADLAAIHAAAAPLLAELASRQLITNDKKDDDV